jgi:hypothetical protein
LDDAVQEIVAAGGYTSVITLGSGFSMPYGVAVDGLGNVFVANYSPGSVQEIMAVGGSIPASPYIRTLATGLNGPDGVAVDGNGNVFVAIYGDGTVLELQAVNGSVPASPVIKTIASGFTGPANLSVDGAGNVFVSDTDDGNVVELLAVGGYTTKITLGNTFTAPEATAVWQNGDVIVADAGTNAVTLLDYADAPALAFPVTKVGLTSTTQTVTVSNNGTASLVFPKPGAGTNPSVPTNFLWDASSTCLQTTPGSSQAFSLLGGKSCTMAFDFKPTVAGNLSGNSVLTDNNLNLPNTTQSINLSGTGATQAAMISPTPGTTLAGASVKFTWSSAAGSTSYALRLGTTVGSNNIYGSGNILATTVTAGNIPTNGATIYARLYTMYGATQYYTDYTYTASTGVPTNPSAVLISPAPNSVLAGASVKFTWSSVSGASGYALRLGTSVGANNLYGSGIITGTSSTAGNLPTNGETIYARLYTYHGSTSVYTDYVFTAAP